jgi:hypothetical protein
LTGDRRRPGGPKAASGDLDVRIEGLVRQVADLINGASAEQRQDLREYAVGLLKEETEVIEAATTAGTRKRADTNPLGMALLLGGISIPMGLLFFPVGLTMFAIALVLGVVGVVGAVIRK